MNRMWSKVNGFDDFYEISKNGLLHSYPRQGTKGGYSYGNDNRGYRHFVLQGNGKKRQVYAHILVYETFIGEVPEGYDVHHKDHNRHNNNVENLELIDSHTHRSDHHKEIYKTNKEKLQAAQKEAVSRPVAQYTLDGVLIAQFKSAKDAKDATSIDDSSILKCCKGKRKTAGGSMWKYLDGAVPN